MSPKLAATSTFWISAILALAAGLPLEVLAETVDTPTFLPAWFGKGPTSLLAQLQCPRQDDDEQSAGVYCQAAVHEDGSAVDGRSFCFGPEGQNDKFALAAESAMDISQFEAARVNGAPVSTYFPFRVLFVYKDDACTLSAIPNLGFQQEEMGLLDFAPQEILTDGGWFWRSRTLGNATGSRRKGYVRRTGMGFVMSLAVSAAGEAGDARMEEKGIVTSRELGSALRAIEKSRFIPGFVDGQAIPMRYYEFLYMDARH